MMGIIYVVAHDETMEATAGIALGRAANGALVLPSVFMQTHI